MILSIYFGLSGAMYLEDTPAGKQLMKIDISKDPLPKDFLLKTQQAYFFKFMFCAITFSIAINCTIYSGLILEYQEQYNFLTPGLESFFRYIEHSISETIYGPVILAAIVIVCCTVLLRYYNKRDELDDIEPSDCEELLDYTEHTEVSKFISKVNDQQRNLTKLELKAIRVFHQKQDSKALFRAIGIDNGN